LENNAVIEAALPELAKLSGEKLETVKDLSALLETAKKKNRGIELVEEIKNDMGTELTELKTLVNSMREEYKNIDEQNKSILAERANLKSLWENSNAEERKGLWEHASKEFGTAAAELAIFGNNVEKMLYGRFSRSDERYHVAKKVREVSDLALTMTAINKGTEEGGDNGDDPVINVKNFNAQLNRLEKYGFEGVETFRKASALDTATANEGKDFIPTDLSQSIIEQLWLDLVVPNLIERINMTTPTFQIPQITSRGRAYLMGESTAPSDFYTDKTTADGFSTDKMEFVARKLAASMYFSDDIQEDAQIPLAQIVVAKILEAMKLSIEDMVINGNRSDIGAGLDNAGVSKLWTSTSDARYLADGIRYGVAAGQKVDSSGTLDLAALRKCRKAMGKFGIFPSELAWVFNPVSLPDILGIDQVLRWRDIREKATVMTGMLAEIDGIPIVMSEYIYTNLNASGVYDNITTTKTIGLLFRPSGYAFGDRRLMRVETDRQITSGQRAVVATWRGDFRKKRTNMTAYEASILYNLVS
jgi:HK97 family phage major capsid protein